MWSHFYKTKTNTNAYYTNETFLDISQFFKWLSLGDGIGGYFHTLLIESERK